MTKFDPYFHERAYKRWQDEGMAFDDLPQSLATMLQAFLTDMEVGANVNPGSKRGPRSYCRLNNLRSRLQSWGLILAEELDLESWEALEARERELLFLVKRMREGQIMSRRKAGESLSAVGTYVKALKSFWHWYQRVERKAGREVRDITIDLDARDKKPKFNYFTIDDLKKLCDKAKQDYKVMMLFLFDSGIRAPTEMMNVRVNDLEWDGKSGIYTLTIREEAAKTFGRKIKLMLCSEILRAFLTLQQLKPNERIFTKVPMRVNQYLKKLGHQVLGIGQKIGDDEYNIKDGLTLYDFRHAAACYWLPRYKSESALKYRFGWKKSDMIHYYTELLGMKDTIQEEDLYVDISKTELEREINEKGKEIDLLKEQLGDQDQKMKEIMKVLKALQLERMLEN
jgi:integrase